MQLILQQTFPLGRFHATPWKAFPYDDPHGEWPPSPWRLVRAVLARSFQLDREVVDSTADHANLREAIVRSFATSEVSFHLAASTWRGPGLRQYQPVDFDWGYAQPAKKKLIQLPNDLASTLGGTLVLLEKGQPNLVEVFDAQLRSCGMRSLSDEQANNLKELTKAKSTGLRKLKRYPPDARTYNTSKVLDNFWVTSSDDASPVVWLIDGPDWTEALLSHLDACLARMTYFGRAESITEVRRLTSLPSTSHPLVKLLPRRTNSAVPVLTLKPDASLAQLEATTDAPTVRDTDIPPGSRWLYAERPKRPAIKPIPRSKPSLPPVSLIQFAIGSKVAPSYKTTVWITERFRGRAAANLTKALTRNPKTDLADMTPDVREQVLRFLGKNTDGKRAEGHQHPFFFLWGEPEAPSRLCVWRAEPFNDTEQSAILDAANSPLPLNHKDEPWTLTLVPLDKLVPPPPGFDARTTHRCWKSITPYVPPRHVHGRNSKEKPGCSVEEQIRDELASRHLDIDEITLTHSKAGWVKLHRQKSAQGVITNNDKLGYEVTLTFPQPVAGPLLLGASCHFGLGLFVPV